jgi:type IV secretion system protein VirB2
MNYLRKNRKKVLVLFYAIFIVYFLSLAGIAYASSAPGAGALPWESALSKVMESITGPVAIGISLVAIVAAGAGLIFGGDMQGFMRTACYICLVVAVLVGAANLLSILFGKSAFIPF